LNDNERETARAIGSLEATVKHLTETWKRQDDEATEGRRRLYDKVDELKVEVSRLASHTEVDELKTRVINLAGQVEGLEARVTAIEPRAEEWNNQQQQAIGSKKVMALVWAGMLTFTGAVTAIAIKLLDVFWPPKH
jgi:hypothetical protein